MAGERFEDAGLVVVGASLAGLVAAIAAADRGHRVVLVERAKDLGGLGATESESIAAAGTRFQRVADVVDAPERLLDELASAARPPVDRDLAHALVAQGASLVEWLADRCGVQVSLQSTAPTGGHAIARIHAVGEQGGASLLAALARAASHHTHVRVRTTTEVERLLPADGGGIGGVALRPDRRGATAIRGPVVLACGGFVADDELVARHAPEVAALPYLGPAGGKGDALRLAPGAATRDLSVCTVTALLAQPSHLVVTRAVIDQGGMLVNQRGERFTDESAASLPLATAIRAQPGRVAYLIFDERIATAVGAHDPFFARVVLPRTSRRANSLAMLSKQLELAESGLADTLERFNATSGGGDAFGRRRPGAGLAEPLYGIRVTGARRATRGGLAVDPSAHVLDEGGGTVPGLFAVGGSAAGLAGNGGDGELVGLDGLAGLGLARLAALSLAPIADEDAG